MLLDFFICPANFLYQAMSVSYFRGLPFFVQPLSCIVNVLFLFLLHLITVFENLALLHFCTPPPLLLLMTHEKTRLKALP